MSGRNAWVVGGCVAACVLAATGAGDARAGGWADALFSETAHDFGPVPRGAKVRHSFVMTNRSGEPLTIVSVRPSCGCTSGHATTSVVAPGQSAAVEAEMDTRNFVGRKDTVLYVTLVTTSGREGEARLGVGSTILSDVVLNPGTADFGVVTRGQSPSVDVTVDRVGMPNWRALRIVSTCRAIDAILQETRRDGHFVSYKLTVSVRPDAPAGAFRDEVRLVTNDPSSPVVPVQVSGMVRGDLTASPSTIDLGRSASVGKIEGRFLVRGSRPFVVKGFEGEGDGFALSVDNAEARPLHVVTVTFDPEKCPVRGDLRRTFRAYADLPGEGPVEVNVALRVEP